jgi:outer membrane protein W
MRLGALSLIAALSLLEDGASFAQAYSDPGLGIGGHAAYTKGRDAETGAFSGGVQLRARLTGGLGVEGLVSYRRETYAVAGVDVLRVEEIPVQGSVQLFFFARTPVQPYVLGGGGYYYVRGKPLGPNEDERSSESKFAFHGGFGVDLRASRKVSLHGDVRYVFLDVDSVKELKERFDTDRRADFWHATAGLTFYF